MDGRQWQREREKRGGQEQQGEEKGEENRSNANKRALVSGESHHEWAMSSG
jgi:hypothetical protein